MPAHHTVLSLETRSSTFFGDTVISFTDGLDTLMGGRGSGKRCVTRRGAVFQDAAEPQPGPQVKRDLSVRTLWSPPGR